MTRPHARRDAPGLVHQTRIRPRRGLAAALLTVLMMIASVPGVSALVAQAPLVTDGPDHPIGPDGRVNDIVVVGNVAYIGGSFTSVGGEPRSNIAAINLSTGKVTAWNPGADAQVDAVAASEDGSIIYIGGTFATVDGAIRRRAAAIEVGSGNVTAWNPRPSARVRVIGVAGSTVYIGGGFRSIGGEDIAYVAAVNATTGNVDTSWNPNPSSAVVALAVAPNGNTVYIGGDFAQVGGSSHPFLAAINAATGNVTQWDTAQAHIVLDIAVSANSATVYTAGGGSYSTGGNVASAFSASAGGAPLWSHQADGDFQAVAYAGDTVYFGGHFYHSEGPIFNKLISYDSQTGARNNDWNPGANSILGIWALTYANDLLLVGGDFTTIGGEDQPHFAVLAETGAGANVPPGAAFHAECDGLTCVFDAGASGDLDGFVVGYDWAFDDGTDATGAGVVHTYRSAGTYTVRLTVEDNEGATGTTTDAVATTNQPPIASLSVTCTSLTCAFDAGPSTDPEGALVDFDWDFGDGTTGEGPDVDHTYPASGSYPVALVVTDDHGATASATIDLDVVASPVHVHSLSPKPIDHDALKWRAIVVISVHDAEQQPVEGALVEGFFGQGKERSCTTNAAGKCKVKVKVNDNKTRIPWTVTGVTAVGAYDTAANHEAAGGDVATLVWQP